MPKLKVDHVVSFSSEDPVYTASNVVLPDPTKKWKCEKPGEKSASIILQLEKASMISSIDIGNEHSAYVEILVSRSSSTDDFKPLRLMSSLMTPLESRQSTNINQVRMFGFDDFQSPERNQKWDRVKIVCTQPFNRHVQYGLSFVTINSLEAKEPEAVKLGNFTLRASSPDNLSAGSLFARRKEIENAPAALPAAVAIREASSSPSVKKEPLHIKPKPKNSLTPSTSKQDANSESPKPRNRDELLYSKDEETVNEKIDKLIETKNKEKQVKKEKEEAERRAKEQSKRESKETERKEKKIKKETKLNESSSSKAKVESSSKLDTSKRKINGLNTPNKKAKLETRKPFRELLNRVTIVISGIQNPERATIRSEALAMGAKYKPDWDNTCTHLICAFMNTPKYNQVKGKGKIINRLWVSDCYSQRKRLPWRRYALDTKEQSQDESEDEILEFKDESPQLQIISDDDSTDIEDAMENIQTRMNTENKAVNTVYSADTDEEVICQSSSSSLPTLPDFFSGKIFHIDKELPDKDKGLLVQYVTAYNGILVDDPSDVVDFAVSSAMAAESLKGACPEASVVGPDWIWKCHNEKKLVDYHDYTL